MANQIRFKRASGSDPTASDLAIGEPGLRTDTAELFFKKDDGTIAKVSGGGGGPDFKYLALRNAANNGAASYPNADFTLVTSGTTNAITPAAANTLLVSVNGVIQKPNTGTSTPSSGFALSGSTIKFGANISAAPDFILYQESGGIGEPSDETVTEAKLKVSNNPVNGYFLSAQSGNTGGLTWAAPVATSCTGNSATATALATARAINGVNFDGTSAITVTAAAGTLSGNTLNSSVVTSSLTSLGDLAGLTVNGDMALTGANYNVLWDKSDNALEFADNAKAIFGTGSDLQIYHDGLDSYIRDMGTGELWIDTLNGDSVNIISDGSLANGKMARFFRNGAVELYYDNAKKLETDTNGITVTGDLVVDTSTLKVDSSNNRVGIGTTSPATTLAIKSSGANTNQITLVDHDSTNEVFRVGQQSDGDGFLQLVQDEGTVGVSFDASGVSHISGGNLGIGATTGTDFSLLDGIVINTDNGDAGLMVNSSSSGHNAYISFSYGSGSSTSHSDQFSAYIGRVGDDTLIFGTNNNIRVQVTSSGHVVPNTDSQYDLGLTGTRWRNIYADTLYGDGSNLTGVSAGATGGGSDEVFYENSTTVTTSYSITSNKNAMSAGPISVNSGAVVTVPSGSVWTIV